MPLTLTKDDKEWIRLTSEKLIYAVTEGVLETHIKICPHGKFLATSKSLFLGILIGVGLCSGGAGFAVAKILF
jgi:hypothetical protein